MRKGEDEIHKWSGKEGRGEGGGERRTVIINSQKEKGWEHGSQAMVPKITIIINYE